MIAKNHRAERIFTDAESLYQEAMDELDRGSVVCPLLSSLTGF